MNKEFNITRYQVRGKPAFVANDLLDIPNEGMAKFLGTPAAKGCIVVASHEVVAEEHQGDLIKTGDKVVKKRPYCVQCYKEEKLSAFIFSSKLNVVKCFIDKAFKTNARKTLPKTVKVYRGTNVGIESTTMELIDKHLGSDKDMGMFAMASIHLSWTLSKKKAHWFTSQAHNELPENFRPVIMELTIPREWVMFHIGGDEEEVLLDLTNPEVFDAVNKAFADATPVEPIYRGTKFAQVFG